MKILTISDSFKGTMSSTEVGQIVTDYYVNKGYDASYIPISDGGEGFIDAVENITKIKPYEYIVNNANFKATKAKYIVDEINKIAYVELAESSGIAKLNSKDLRPQYASTYGLGELLKHIILSYKIKKIILGIGGSATTDLGCGMLEAMGVEFLDNNGFKINKMCNANLMRVRKIKLRAFKKLIHKVEFITLTDVDNPLLGKKGTVNIFAKQKGAKDEDLFVMEKNILHLYNTILTLSKKMPTDFPKAGAAGGVGYTMKAFFNSKIISGIDTILEMINLQDKINDYDIVFTGEGRLDRQSLEGKTIIGITKFNPQRLIILCGQNKLQSSKFEVYSLISKVSLKEAMEKPKESLIKLLDEIKI